jgi:adenosylcobinamide-GDP ribazoletransferase
MFSVIPPPYHLWNDLCLNLMLPYFPVIGILLGLIWWGLAELLMLSAIHIMLTAGLLTVTPFLLTGFLHLDGYMDTSDAILSRRPLEEKLRILKDPHKGAFSVSMVAVLYVLQFAAVYAAVDFGRTLTPLVFISVISRCCASISLLSLNVMPQSGYASMFRLNTRVSHKVFVITITVSTIAAAYLFAGFHGLAAVLSAVAGFSGAMAYSYKELKGVSGDLAGFSLVISELCGLIMLGAIQ